MIPEKRTRTFWPSTRYDHLGWWAIVTATVPGANAGRYWREPRFTRWGAQWAAARMAQKLNRYERKGWLAP